MTTNTIEFWKGIITIIVTMYIPIMGVYLVFFRRYPHTYVRQQGALHTGVFHIKDNNYVEVMGSRYICSKCKKKYDTIGAENPNMLPLRDCKIRKNK